ncbi:hypothetical protein EV715DRAFT_297194 [Schizophyllum commune]
MSHPSPPTLVVKNRVYIRFIRIPQHTFDFPHARAHSSLFHYSPPSAPFNPCSAPARVYHAGVAPVGKENATLVFLARNSDLDEVKTSVERMERRYNHHNRYPPQFLFRTVSVPSEPLPSLSSVPSSRPSPPLRPRPSSGSSRRLPMPPREAHAAS